MSISADRPAVLIGLSLALAACSEAERAPSRQEEAKSAPRPVAEAKATDAPEPTAPPDAQGDDAADVLTRYYGFIEARRYEDARMLRESGERGPSAAEFAANFEAFADHRATIGTPSKVAEAQDWLYVEVPVQTYGTYRNGTPFGSGGTVTLRRRKTGGEWRIYPGG